MSNGLLMLQKKPHTAVLYVCGNIIEIEVMLSRQPDFLVVEIVDHDVMAIL